MVAACLVLAPAAARAADRVALVLGATAYEHFERSPVTAAELGAIASALEAAGFETTLATDATNSSGRVALGRFSRRADGADVAIVVLAGHVATLRGVTYFLPVSAQPARPTDLLSQGLAAPSFALAMRGAKEAALLAITTTDDAATRLGGLSPQPSFAGQPPANFVAAFSASRRVPQSQMNAVALAAARNLADAARDPAASLALLADAVAATDLGLIVGAPSSTLFRAPPEPEPEPEPAKPEPEPEPELELAEPEPEPVTEPEPEPEPEKPVAEGLDGDAERPVPGDLEKPVAPPTVSDDRLAQLRLLEGLMGRGQKREIQRRLRALGLYDGPIDAVFGPLTRNAIEAFQRERGAPVTGVLSPAELQALLR